VGWQGSGIAMMLVRVEAPHFVAGFVMDGNVCTRAAPIIKYFVGRPADWIRAYCATKKWRANIVGPS
jgi:hypothetical protein